jgi:hypothetical protein
MKMDVVHVTTAVSSSGRMHILDDVAMCWCHPWVEVVDGRVMITHMAEEKLTATRRNDDIARDADGRRG